MPKQSIKKICVSGMMAEKEWTKKKENLYKKRKLPSIFLHIQQKGTQLLFHSFIILLSFCLLFSCNMKHTSIYNNNFLVLYFSFLFCIFYYAWHVKVPPFFIGVFVFVLKDVWWGADDWEKLLLLLLLLELFREDVFIVDENLTKYT